MAMNKEPDRRNVSQWLGIAQSTLRGWDTRFRPWLESEPGEFGDSTRKKYTPNDLLVFQAIHQLRARALSYDEIEQQLEREIGRTVLAWPGPIGEAAGEADDGSGEGEGAGGRGLAIVERQLVAQLQDARVDLASTAAKLEAIELERERLIGELERERQARIDAERAAAAANARLEERQAGGFWQRLLGRRGGAGEGD